MHYFGVRSYGNGFAPNASILLHWIQNDVRLSFGAISKLSACKRYKTCVLGPNALFWCSEVAEIVLQQMHPFYSIGPEVMFGCVLEHLGNLQHVKRCKTFCFGTECTILVYRSCGNSFAPNASILLHWTPNNVPL
jgi:hypothetical protein